MLDKHSINKDFMLAEYNHLSESFFKSEEEGERRATFFLTITGAIITILGIAFSGDNPPETSAILWAIVLTFPLLIIVGYLTFIRLVFRNIKTEEYKGRLALVRKWFYDSDFEKIDSIWKEKITLQEREELKWNSLGKGGWLQTVGVLNSLIMGSLTFACVEIIFDRNVNEIKIWNDITILAVIIFLVSALGYWLYLVKKANTIIKRSKKEKEKIRIADTKNDIESQDPNIFGR